MNYKNEKQLLLIIKYTLPVLVFILSILITIFLYKENKNDFEKISKEIENNFVNSKKQIIKEQVDNLYNYIISEQKNTEGNLKKSLHERVIEAHKIITNIYKEHSKDHTKEQITDLIRTILNPIRFNNNRGYIFAFNNEAINIIHPAIPALEGKDFYNHQDAKGEFITKTTLSLLSKNDEAYQEWYWRKDKSDLKEYKKIGFVKNVYELDWYIGTGEYVEDFSKDIQKKVLSQIENLKFGKNGYFIVTDNKNNYISHANKSILGHNVFDKLKNLNTEKNFKKISDTINNKDEGFIELNFYKPNQEKITEKIVYMKKVPKWDWIISTGFYIDEIDEFIQKEKQRLKNNYKQNLQNLFAISIISTIILLTISFHLSKLIQRKFKKYKKDIQKQIEKNQKQAELLSQKSKLAAMGEMIENIAHQWRQPLSIISTASTGIQLHKEMNTLTDTFLLESITNITSSANHLSDTIEDFRDFFKPDKDKTIFSIKKAIQRAFNLIKPQLKNNNIKIIENLEEIEIIGFERELIQVLLNILNNAKDSLKEIEDEKLIFIDTYKRNNCLIIKITDSGKGIKNKILERIFEPYFTTKHKSQGTGIGLYMSREIITRHMNGVITAQNISYTYEDKRYYGALFTIELPLEKD